MSCNIINVPANVSKSNKTKFGPLLDLPLPENIWRLFETVLDETLQFYWGPRHHMFLLFSLHWHWGYWNTKFIFAIEKKHVLPTTVSLNVWLILGFVETWHSNFPASVALVNFSFKVFWPLLKKSSQRILLRNLFNRHRHLPSWDQFKSLIIDVFFISDK